MPPRSRRRPAPSSPRRVLGRVLAGSIVVTSSQCICLPSDGDEPERDANDEPSKPALELSDRSTPGTVQESIRLAGEWLEVEHLRAPPLGMDGCRKQFGWEPLAAGQPVRDAVLVCMIEASRDRDYEGTTRTIMTGRAPDLDIAVALDGEPAALFTGEANDYEACVSLPLVSLDEGDRVHLQLWDRDPPLIFNPIGSGSGAYTGSFPLTVEGEDFSARCRALDPKAVQAHVTSEILPSIDERLQQLQAAGEGKRKAPSPRELLEELRWMQERFRVSALYLGWADTRVQERRASLHASTKKIVERGPEPASEEPRFGYGPSTFEVRIDRVACVDDDGAERSPRGLTAPMHWPNTAGTRCGLVGEITVDAPAGKEILIGAPGPVLETHLVTATGAVIELVPEVTWGARVFARIGGQVEQELPRNQPVRLRMVSLRPLDWKDPRYGGPWRLLVIPRADWAFDEQPGYPPVVVSVEKLPVKPG